MFASLRHNNNLNSMGMGGLPSSSSSLMANNDPLINSKRRVVVSKEVDIAIERLIEELIEYYIFTWYRPLLQRGQGTCTNNSQAQDASQGERISDESLQQLRSVLKYSNTLIYWGRERERERPPGRGGEGEIITLNSSQCQIQENNEDFC